MPRSSSMNDDVTKVKTARECSLRWARLIEVARVGSDLRGGSRRSHDDDDDDDPFDCSDLIVPPSHELVNVEVEGGVRRWRDLASRVIVDDDGGDEEEVEDGREGAARSRRRDRDLLLDATEGGDQRRQRLMPINFDYACRREGGRRIDNDDDDDDGGGKSSLQKEEEEEEEYGADGRPRHRRLPRPRVISLLDPTRTLDYEEELWRSVFRPVRTSEELEEAYALGGANATARNAIDDCGGPKTNDDVPPLGCRHSLDVKRNLGGWFAKYSRMDAHSLGRLRVRDRHSEPPPSSSASVIARSGEVGDSLVRFEILRHSQNLKRGSGVDCNRLEVELHGGQRTLLDLHRLMVEFALDKEAGAGNGGFGGGSVGGCSSRITRYDEEGRGREEGGVHAATPTIPLDAADDTVSGVFFIENAFYTCGEAGRQVAESILRWLDCEEEPADKPVIVDGEGPSLSPTAGKPTPPSQRRRRLLGVAPPSWPSTRAQIIPMSETKLEDLPLRLGVRYFHMFVPPPIPSSLRLLLERRHGGDAIGENYSSWSLAYESAVFVTGIRTLNVDREAFKKKRRSRRSNDQSTMEDNEEEEEEESEDKAPILIHDTWAPQRHICLACNHSPASVVTVNDELTDAAPPGLDPTTNKVQLQGVPMCSSCYRALHYYQQRPNDEEDGVGGGCDEDVNDRNQPSLKLRPSKNGQASLVFPIEEYQRLVTATSLEEVPKCSAF